LHATGIVGAATAFVLLFFEHGFFPAMGLVCIRNTIWDFYGNSIDMFKPKSETDTPSTHL
jgi:hypothetical protein